VFVAPRRWLARLYIGLKAAPLVIISDPKKGAVVVGVKPLGPYKRNRRFAGVGFDPPLHSDVPRRLVF
jgi:hypothetical protein